MKKVSSSGLSPFVPFAPFPLSGTGRDFVVSIFIFCGEWSSWPLQCALSRLDRPDAVVDLLAANGGQDQLWRPPPQNLVQFFGGERGVPIG